MQGERDALPQLIVAVKRLREEGPLDRIDRVKVAQADGLIIIRIDRLHRALLRTVVEWEGQIRVVRSFRRVCRRDVELLVEICSETHRLHARNFRGCWSPARLFEKANRVGIA